jgi:hypothetical protein
VRWGTNSFLVVWSYSTYVRGRMLSASGTFNTAQFNLAQSTSSTYFPTAAFDGTNFLSVWRDYRNSSTTSYDVYGQRVSASGSTVGSSIAVSTGPLYQYDPQVIYCGGRYNVFFRDQRYSVYYVLSRQLVKTDGTLTGTTATKNDLLYADTTSVNVVDAACGGSKALVVWNEYSNGTYRVKGLLVTP